MPFLPLNLHFTFFQVLPLQNVKKILLQDNQITQLANDVMQSGIVEEIRLDNNPLQDLDPKLVAEMYLMRSLSLQGSALSQLPSNMSSMMELSFLDVTGNRLRALPASLVQLQLLETLRASKNLLECLPNNMRNMTSLKILELNDNRIVMLPMELGILSRLTRCLIANNPIQIPNPAVMALGAAMMFEYMRRVWSASTETFSLDLSGLNLDDVPSEVLVCTALTDLRLEHSGLLKVPALVVGMVSLQQLWLARNCIACFPPEICSLPCLHRLRLSFNQIPLIPEEIGSLTKLKELWLDSNPISVIPVGVGRLSNLTLLRIDAHRLSSPPASIANAGPEAVVKYLGGLIHAVQSGTLDLSNLCMLEFPAEIWGLKDCLTSLLLQNNYFDRIPSSISQLTRLTHLDVTGCPICEIPLAVGSMSSLTSVAVTGGHRLKNPPPDISEQGSAAILRFMQNMNHANIHGLLDLQEMQLRSLPAAVFAIPGLVELQMQGNRKVEMPDDHSSVRNLKFLRLERCPIQQLPDEVLYFTRLRTLRVNGCRLFTLPATFGKMCNLKRFSAPDNSIQSIMDDSLIGLTSLQKLNLDRNALVTLPGTVSCLISLRKLRVCSNQLA
jgi:Leucine-rich repeat (LRR) protein